MRKNIFLKVGLIALIVAVDLVSKYLLEGKIIELINGVISFSSTHNTGAAWSILDGQILLFVIGAIIFVVGMFAYDHFFKETNKVYTAGFIMLLAGAIGNGIDRAVFGYVRDFIKLDFINFPIFNIADISLVVGAIIFSVYILFFSPEEEKK
jgi:signal peptidase II